MTTTGASDDASAAAQAGRAVQAGQIERAEQVKQATQTGQAAQTGSTEQTDKAARAAHTAWLRALGLGAVLSAVACLVLLAFSWPSVTLDPKGLPIAIAGPAAAIEPVEAALEQEAAGTFTLIDVADRDAAVEAITTREAYGAIVLGSAPEVLTSSAASTATHQLLTQLQAQLQVLTQQQSLAQAQAAGTTPPNVSVMLSDVVPLVESDSRGTGLTAAALPLVFGGMIGGIGIVFAVVGTWRRIVALITYAIAGGLAIAGILQGWFDVLGGDYWLNASAFSLSLLAMGATIVGFAALFGRPGIAVGPILFILIGNPISGATFPKEFYPAPWGQVGQWLPPGAGATLVRDTSYFPDADAWQPILVLAGWTIIGLILTVIGYVRDQRRFAVGA